MQEAHKSGLSLLVVSAVNFKPLCMAMPEENRKYSCNDMEAVDRQIDALHRFVAEHDWAQIALSPEHARSIINSGKLAIILSIEVSDLFEGMDWRKALDHYYARGVRTLQLVHQLDNRFAGAALHNDIFKLFQFLRNLKNLDLKRFAFDTDSQGRNKKGLTPEGKELIKAMMEKKMMIDLAHLSQQGIQDVKSMMKDLPYKYPLYISHGHFKEIMEGKFESYEKSSPTWVLDLLKEHHGIFGLRTGAEATKSFGKVPNDCDGSTKSFAQAYEYGMSKGVAMAFGSDLNGFIQQLRPRFGNKDETCGASGDKRRREMQQKVQSGQLGKSFDQSGFGHMGQIGDIVSELKNFGVDTSVIENSSEIYIRMWEKAYPTELIPPPVMRMPASEPGAR